MEKQCLVNVENQFLEWLHLHLGKHKKKVLGIHTLKIQLKYKHWEFKTVTIMAITD